MDLLADTDNVEIGKCTYDTQIKFIYLTFLGAYSINGADSGNLSEKLYEESSKSG